MRVGLSYFLTVNDSYGSVVFVRKTAGKACCFSMKIVDGCALWKNRMNFHTAAMNHSSRITKELLKNARSHR